MRKGTPPIASLERALELLQQVAGDAGRNNIASLAAVLGVPTASAHRIVHTFARQDFLTEVERGRYVAGPALVGISRYAKPDAVLAAVARPSLSSLAKRMEAVAHIGTLENDMVTYLVKAAGANTQLFTREGMQLEAYCSAIGKILLAHLPCAARERYLSSGPFVALTDNTTTDPHQLRAELDIVRKQGFAVDDCEVADDLTCLAVPVVAADGRVRAAISVSILVSADHHPKRTTLLAQMRQTARTIARLVEKILPSDYKVPSNRPMTA